MLRFNAWSERLHRFHAIFANLYLEIKMFTFEYVGFQCDGKSQLTLHVSTEGWWLTHFAPIRVQNSLCLVRLPLAKLFSE